MGRQHNIDLVNRYFSAMAAGEWDTVEAMYHDDIVMCLAGTTPASGCLHGKEAVTRSLIAQQVHAALVPEEIHFAKKWKIMCADEERITVIMEGGGPTLNGDSYEQTYCEIFRFEDDRVIEMHAFFDTALAERALFDNPLRDPRQGETKDFSY